MQERTLDLPGGHRIRLWDAGNGPPLLLLHGVGASGNSFLFNLPVLSKQYRCLSPDLPGYGGSSMPPRFMTIPALAATLFDVLDLLGLKEARIFGHSMGAVLAAEMALLQSGRVPRLVLEGPVGARRDSSDRAGGTLLRWIRDDGIPRLKTLDEARLIAEKVDEQFIELANVDLERSRGFLNSVAALAGHDGFARAGGVRCPTLVLWGEHDRMVPSAEAADWANAIPGATRHIFAGVGHCPHFEAMQQFHELLLKFLA